MAMLEITAMIDLLQALIGMAPPCTTSLFRAR
jgi:hypothetical protein